MGDPSAYEVQLAPIARRQLAEQLPERVAAACIEFLAGPLAQQPHRVGAPLRAPYEGYYRARRGEYRIRYRIADDERVVYVVNIAHRRDAYRS